MSVAEAVQVSTSPTTAVTADRVGPLRTGSELMTLASAYANALSTRPSLAVTCTR